MQRYLALDPTKLVLPTLDLIGLLVMLLTPRSYRARAVRGIGGKAVLVALIGGTFLLAALSLAAILQGDFGIGFGGDRQLENMTYDQYISTVGIDTFDPKGASDISFRCHSTIDSYDVWIKLNLPSGACESLLAAMTRNLENPHFVSAKQNNSIPARKTVSTSAYFPSNWPSPEVNPPSWFQSGENGNQVHCTLWDVQLEGRSKGWYWLYDSDSETLRIWEWNRQHFRLR